MKSIIALLLTILKTGTEIQYGDGQKHEVLLYMLSGQRRLKSVKGQPTYCNLVGMCPPTRLVMYCQRYHTTYLYCLLPGQPQVNRSVFGRQLFAFNCLSVGSFLARQSDNSSFEHMTLTRTVVHDVGSGLC